MLPLTGALTVLIWSSNRSTVAMLYGLLTEMYIEGHRRHGSVAENISCCSRGPAFRSSPHADQFTIACNFSSRRSSVLLCRWGSLHICDIHSHRHTYIPKHINENNACWILKMLCIWGLYQDLNSFGFFVFVVVSIFKKDTPVSKVAVATNLWN